MGSSEGEAIAAPAVGGNGGGSVCRALSGGREVTFTAPLPEGCNGHRERRRERQLESVAFIGQGADANVYLVRCKLTGRMSALKVQQKADHEKSVERVQMERELMVDARHPLVAPLYAAFQDRLYLYLEMEYCPGGSLDNFLRLFVKRNLTEDEARFYAAEITLGLEFLHSKGYVYRDLKAANVLVAASGHIKLTDFGIAERGKLKIETDDKAWKEAASPPRPLPRVKSTPVLPHKMTALDVPGTAPATRSRPPPTKAAAGVVVGHSSIHGQRPRTPAGVSETPPRAAPGVHRRASSIPCVALAAGSSLSSPLGSSGSSPSPSGSSSSSPGGASPAPESLPTTTGAAATVSRGGWSSPSFLRRKQQQQRQHPSPLVPGETPPRAPPPSAGLGRRMRGRFSRSSRAPSPAGSPWQLSCSPSSSPELAVAGSSSDSPSSPSSSSSSSGTSVSPGTAIGVRTRPAASAGCGVGESGGGVPPPFSGCRGTPSSRDGGGRENQGKRHAGTRRATVTLGEASWGLLSGSPEYMAPEVLMHDPQGSAVDWWGLGVLTYELLLGRTPFAGENGKNRLTFLNIMNKEASFPEPGGGGRSSSSRSSSIGGGGGGAEGVSEVCQQFIRALLSKDPRGRAGSTFPVREHPFFAGVRWDRLLVEEPPLRVPGCSPPRGGSAASTGGGVTMARPPTPPPVDNTSGWWWDPEDAIDIEEEEEAGERRRKGGGGGGGGGGRAEGEGNKWWPFDRFDWSDGEREGTVCSPLGLSGRRGEKASGRGGSRGSGGGNSSGGGKF